MTILHRILSILAVLTAVNSCFAAKSAWEPIDPADLAAKDSSSLPGVDAEVLFSRHTLDTADGYLITHNYIRAKIYTRKGVEGKGKFTLRTWPGSEIDAVAARVAKLDGTSVELAKTDIFQSTVAKAGHAAVMQTAFAFPNLAPGDIVEYRWDQRESARRALDHFYMFYCQQPVPVREFRFSVIAFPVDYQVFCINGKGAELQKLKHGEKAIALRNLPAFVPEDNMPPERDVCAWIMIVGNDKDYREEEQWQLLSHERHMNFMDRTRPTRATRARAAQLTQGASDEREKLRRLYNFCQSEIANLDWVEAPGGRDARTKYDNENRERSVDDVLGRGSATKTEIGTLFAALARSSGFEVRLALSSSRAELLNVFQAKGWNFLTERLIAVKVGAGWQYFDPGAHWVPFGMLAWWNEGASTLICEPDKLHFETTPISPASASQWLRKGRFTLDATGTLEGSVEEVLTGHYASEIKLASWNKASDEIERAIRQRIVDQMPAAEVLDIKCENLRTVDASVTTTYKARIAGYAERAGARLALPADFFTVGQPAIFTAGSRLYPIYFPHALIETDDIEIVLPNEFAVEDASPPQTVDILRSVVEATYAISYSPANRVMTYKRNYILGPKGVAGLKPDSYLSIKVMFDAIHQSDSLSLMLKRGPTAASAEAGAAH